MIDETIEAIIVSAIALLFSSMVAARIKVECDYGWNVGGVDRAGVVTCMEKIKEPCCGEPTGVVCERACKPTKTTTRKIYCTNGFRPVIRDALTVGCQR